MRLMGHESPITKAAWEFAMADPENCDKEWAAYLALVNVKESASASSPTNSSSPLHHHTPAAAVTAPSTTRSTTSPRVLSSAVSTDDFTVDDLSPAARRLLDVLGGGSSSPTPAAVPSSSTATAPTTPAASRVFLGTKHDHTPEAQPVYDYLIGDSTATASPRGPSSANSTVGVPGLAAATAPAEKDLRSVTTTRVESASSDITKDNLSPEISTVLRDPAMFNATSIAVTSSAPTTCSAECPSHDGAVPVFVLISPAAQTSATTNCNVLSELAAPMAGEKALHVNAMGGTPPTDAICLQVVSDDSTDDEDHMARSLTAQTDVLELFRLSPSTCSTDWSGCIVNIPNKLPAEDYKVFNDESIATTIIPWPQPSCTREGTPLIHGHDLCSYAQQKRGKEFLVVWDRRSAVPPRVQDFEENQGKWSAIWFEARADMHQFTRIVVVKLKPPWPPSLGMPMNLSAGDAVTECHSCANVIPGLEPILMGEHNTSIVGLVDFSNLDMVVSHTVVTVEVLNVNSTNFDAYSDDWLPPWPPPDIESLHSLAVDQTMISTTSSVFEHWLIQWDPGNDLVQHFLSGTTPRAPAQLVDRSGHNLEENFGSLSVTSLLHYSTSVIESLRAIPCWLWCMRCVHLDTASPHKSVLLLQPKPPWSSHAQTISVGVAESLHLVGNSFELKQFGVSAWPLLSASFWSTKAYFHRDDMKHNNRLLVDSSVVGSGDLQCGLEFIQWRIAWSLSLGYLDIGNYCRQLIPDATMAYLTPHACDPKQEAHQLGGHWTFKYALLFSWAVTSAINSVPAMSFSLGMFSQPLQVFELGKYFAMAILLLSNHQSALWIHYLPTTIIIQLGHELMLWEIASTKDGILTYTERVFMSWDPGGPAVLDAVTGINGKSIHSPFLHLTWDPGGYTCNVGLRASRFLRRGDCQRPLFTHYRAGWLGRHPGPWPAWEPDGRDTGRHIRERSSHGKTGFWNRSEGGFGRAWLGVCAVLISISSSS